MPSETEQPNSNLKDITKKNIRNFFRDSNELKIHSSSKQNITTEIEPDYIETVSNIYKEVLNKSPDIGNLKYYANQLKFKIITEDRLRQILKESEESKESDTKSNKEIFDNKIAYVQNNDISTINLELIYCMMGTNRLDEIKPYIETVLKYVDKFIFVDGSSTDGTLEYLNELKSKSNKIVLIQKEWQDRFSEQRNNYLNYLKEINYNGWALTSDTDEHFPEETLKELRTLIKESENGTRYTGVKFQVIDISVDDDDQTKELSRTINEYWKPLMFKYHPDLQYEGEPHERLVGYNVKWLTSELRYEHARSKLHIYTRAAENYFISNSNRYSERWAEFRFLCTKNNILNFKDYWTLFEKHELPKEVEDWIHNHKDDNFDSGDSEIRETAKLYFEILPERKTKKLENKVLNTEKLQPIQKQEEIKIDNKEESIYERLSIGECLIISRTKNNALIASNINGSITFTQVPIPDEDSDSYWKLTETEKNIIRKIRFGVS